MIKEYKDERINNIIKKSFERAVKDEEWSARGLSEWNLLYNCIDKTLEFIESGMTKEIYINRNMWYILQDAFFDILDLYNLTLKFNERVTEKELIIKKPTNKSQFDNLLNIYKKYINIFNNWESEKNENIDNFNYIKLINIFQNLTDLLLTNNIIEEYGLKHYRVIESGEIL